MKKQVVFYGRRFGESAETDPNLWMVAYGDMMTFLMIFFLILFAVTYYSRQATSDSVIDILLGKKIELEDEQILVKKLQKFGKISLTADRINVTFPQDIIFKKGSSGLSSNFRNVLMDVSEYLKKNPDTVIVSGHADSTPLRGGKYKDNWYLSAERGWSVVSELIKNGINPKRLQVRGYGEFNPVASNKTEEGRAKNRRIEMQILKIRLVEAKRYIYYKTTGNEKITDISKRFLGNEKYSQQIRDLNPDKIDSSGIILEDTEILIPFNP